MIFYYGSSSKLIQGPQLGTGALGYELILQKKKVLQGHERRAHSQVGPGVRSMGTSGNKRMRVSVVVAIFVFECLSGCPW